MGTKIAWTDETWNPITGCTPVSEGCKNCYAKRMAKRLAGRHGYPKDGYTCQNCGLEYHLAGGKTCPSCGAGCTRRTSSFDVTVHLDRLKQPLKWRKPRMCFVCSMSDLFHDEVHLYHQVNIWRTMADTPQHTYQVLTKRAYNMERKMRPLIQSFGILSNVWLGVTVENDKQSHRAYSLKNIPASRRFISFEPLLSPITDLNILDGISWIIIGAESGPGRRSMPLSWAIDLVKQCKEADVPVFVKQVEINWKVSHNPDEWPEVLRVREYPK